MAKITLQQAFDRQVQQIKALKLAVKGLLQAPFKEDVFQNDTGGQHYLVINDGNIKLIPDGEIVTIDLGNIDNLGVLDDTARLFIGTTGAVRQTSVGGVKVYLKWNSATNPGDTTIKPNYKTNLLVLEKVSNNEYTFVKWERKPEVFTKTFTLTYDDGSTEDIKVG